jgi:hypothetical protein
MPDDDEASPRERPAAGQGAGLDLIGAGRESVATDASAEPEPVHSPSTEDAEAACRAACGGHLPDDELNDGRSPEHEDDRRLPAPIRA